jgi:hypothetical protein
MLGCTNGAMASPNSVDPTSDRRVVKTVHSEGDELHGGGLLYEVDNN